MSTHNICCFFFENKKNISSFWTEFLDFRINFLQVFAPLSTHLNTFYLPGIIVKSVVHLTVTSDLRITSSNSSSAA